MEMWQTMLNMITHGHYCIAQLRDQVERLQKDESAYKKTILGHPCHELLYFPALNLVYTRPTRACFGARKVLQSMSRTRANLIECEGRKGAFAASTWRLYCSWEVLKYLENQSWIRGESAETGTSTTRSGKDGESSSEPCYFYSQDSTRTSQFGSRIGRGKQGFGITLVMAPAECHLSTRYNLLVCLRAWVLLKMHCSHRRMNWRVHEQSFIQN